MNKDAHLYHYLFLIFGLLSSLFFFLFFNQSHTYQMLSALAGCLFYSLWGITHGVMESRMNKHVAMEYIALSLFVFALVFVSISLK